MPATPSHVVRRADGGEVGELYDLPHQRKVALHIKDDDLARLLAEHGIVPPRPPFLDAAHHGVHGAYAPRPQRNWFLTPPLEEVVAALESVLGPAGYTLDPAPVPTTET
jgi:hypothetical protein